MRDALTLIVAGASALLIACTSGVPGGQPPTVAVDAQQVAPGQSVAITASGFPPNTEVVIGSGPPQSEYDVITRARTDSAGAMATTVRVPGHTGEGGRVVFVVATDDARIKAISNEIPMIESSGENKTEPVTVTGTVTGEGVECPAIRGDDGQLYTVLGKGREKLREGLRVRVTGSVAQISFCMQGTTINATDVVVLE